MYRKTFFMKVLLLCCVFFAVMHETTVAWFWTGSKLEFRSFDLPKEKMIPDPFTCAGDNVSPQLEWTGEPVDTKSFVLLIEDVDAPGMEPFVHWLLFNIPANVNALGQNIDTLPKGTKRGRNDFGKLDYRGPCPSPSNQAHHYVFRLYALDRELGLDEGAIKKEVMREMKKEFVLDSTEFTRTFLLGTPFL